MQFKSFRALALATTAVMGLSLLPTNTQAADNASMGVSVESIDAVSVTKLNDINFGKWLLDYQNSENIVLTLNPNTNAVTFPALTDSSAQQIAGTSRSGRVNVTIPSGINNYTLDMTASAPTAFTDTTAYELTSVSYSTATETVPTTMTTDGVFTHPVTVVTGGTPETVYFGGVLTVKAQPANNIVDSNPTFTVTFAY